MNNQYYKPTGVPRGQLPTDSQESPRTEKQDEMPDYETVNGVVKRTAVPILGTHPDSPSTSDGSRYIVNREVGHSNAMGTQANRPADTYSRQTKSTCYTAKGSLGENTLETPLTGLLLDKTADTNDRRYNEGWWHDSE